MRSRTAPRREVAHHDVLDAGREVCTRGGGAELLHKDLQDAGGIVVDEHLAELLVVVLGCAWIAVAAPLRIQLANRRTNRSNSLKRI